MLGYKIYGDLSSNERKYISLIALKDYITTFFTSLVLIGCLVSVVILIVNFKQRINLSHIVFFITFIPFCVIILIYTMIRLPIDKIVNISLYSMPVFKEERVLKLTIHKVNIPPHWKRYIEPGKVLKYRVAQFERLSSILSDRGKLENIIGIESMGLTIKKNREYGLFKYRRFAIIKLIILILLYPLISTFNQEGIDIPLQYIYIAYFIILLLLLMSVIRNFFIRKEIKEIVSKSKIINQSWLDCMRVAKK